MYHYKIEVCTPGYFLLRSPSVGLSNSKHFKNYNFNEFIIKGKNKGEYI